MNPDPTNSVSGTSGSTDPLAALRDIHLPEDPGWWPPAVGWWVLTVVLIGLLIWSSLALYREWRRRAPGREFRRALLAIDLDGPGSGNALQSMSGLTRRYLMSLYGRQRIASLSGTQWLGTLDKLTGNHVFSRGPGEILATGPYSKSVPDPSTLLAVRRCLLDLAGHRPRSLPALK